jgi:SAM-dependent methyltransferase
MPMSLDRYYFAVFGEELVSAKSPSASRKLQYYLESLFESVSFKNKTVLDIGGGSGIFSFYAACSGAEEVVCLEPEAAGSRSGVLEKFRRTRSRLQLDQVRLEPITFQAYDAGQANFDVVLLHNSVNHLDEPACVNLQKDEAAGNVYRSIFSKIYDVCRDGAKLIVCDCSRHNFFAHLKMKNPLAPSIEWHKHQAPEIWARLLREAGFRNPVVDWKAPSVLRSAGERMLGNKVSAYFLTSHFCLRMEKPFTLFASAGVANRIHSGRSKLPIETF